MAANRVPDNAPAMDDQSVVKRILEHIGHRTTDMGDEVWREPVEHYLSPERFASEMALLRHYPVPFCPSAAIAGTGAYVAREAAGTPLVVVRDADGSVKAFRNACRHRGMQVAEGSGTKSAFACRYHGWTYGLDGALRHVPHEHGFPGLDPSVRGLVPVAAFERHGLVWVTQEAPALANGALEALPPLVPQGHRLLGADERVTAANWKVVCEGFLEGYHLRTTHPGTFYPLQYDNVNVVETFGPHRRIAFPYRAIEKLRGAPPEARSADGKLTYVYHLFPNVMVATFPGRIVMVVLEPIAIDATRFVTFLLTDRDTADAAAGDAIKRGGDFVNMGAVEDRDVACAIQRSLGSGANEFFEFGLFEGAIVHFHRTLRAAIE